MTEPRKIIGRVVTRGAWGAMCLIHAPILAAIISSIVATPEAAGTDRLFSAAVLLAVTLIFALKTLDVAWLRIGTPRQGLWVLCLAAAIVHHGALGVDRITAPTVIAVAATAGELGRRAPRFVRILQSLLGTGPLSLPIATAIVSMLGFARPVPVQAGSIRSRGPPARIH